MHFEQMQGCISWNKTMFNFSLSANTATYFHRRGHGRFSLSNESLACKETVPRQGERETEILHQIVALHSFMTWVLAAKDNCLSLVRP